MIPTVLACGTDGQAFLGLGGIGRKALILSIPDSHDVLGHPLTFSVGLDGFALLAHQMRREFGDGGGNLSLRIAQGQAVLRAVVGQMLDQIIGILATENLNKARYLRQSPTITAMHSNFISELEDVLRRGSDAGEFRDGLDPIDVYLTIASLGAFYLSNRFTLSTIFQRDLTDPAELERWGQHIVDTLLAAVRPA